MTETITHRLTIRDSVERAAIGSLAFILPSFSMVWAISVAHVRYGGLLWMQALFDGVGAALIGIIPEALTS